MVAELGSGRDRERAPVQRVHAVGVDVAGEVGGANDPGDGEDLVRQEAQLGDGGLERVENAEIAAARAPVGVRLGLEVLGAQRRAPRLDRERGRGLGVHLGHCGPPQTRISCTGTYLFVLPARIFFTPSATWCGRKGSPSYLRMCASAAMPVSDRRYRADWPP